MYPGGIDGVLESGDNTGTCGALGVLVATAPPGTANGSYEPEGIAAGAGAGGAGAGMTGLNVNGSGVGCGAINGDGDGVYEGDGARAVAAPGPASGEVTGARSMSMLGAPVDDEPRP